MLKLIWGFACRTYHIVGNLMSQLICWLQVVSYGSDADIARNKEKLSDQLTKMAKSKPPTGLIKLSMEFEPATNNQEGFKDMFGDLSKTRSREPVVKVLYIFFSYMWSVGFLIFS